MKLKNAINIIHTNDLHGKLTEISAQKLKAFKAETPNCLLLDAGDAVKIGNIGIPLKQEPIWEKFQLAEYDAGTLGNREFHISRAVMKAKLNGAPCPILCANINDKSGETMPITPFIIREVGGVSVGIFGLCVPMVTERMKAKLISNYLFEPAITTAKRVIDEIKESCDFLIAMTHIGYKQDIALATACPEINLIIGGHSHTHLEEPEFVGQTAIVQAYAHAQYFGKVTINEDGLIQGETFAFEP